MEIKIDVSEKALCAEGFRSNDQVLKEEFHIKHISEVSKLREIKHHD